MNKSDHLIVNFTPTGMVPQKKDNHFVPISTNEIIDQVHEMNEVGITLVHLHARNEDGQPTHKIGVYREIVEGIQKHCPELVICVSLSGRKCQELEGRSEVLDLKPDMGSLTLSSLNFIQQASVNSPEIINGLIERMKENGVRPELECFDLGMINYAKYLIAKNKITDPLYFNLLFGNIASAQADASHIGLAIKELPKNSYWSMGGIGVEQLKMNSIAIALGGGVRIGLEDNIWYDKKKTVLASNRSLLERVHLLASIHEREVMSSNEFGLKGFYNSNRLFNE